MSININYPNPNPKSVTSSIPIMMALLPTSF
jgi:hypothetical protein